MKLYSEGKNYKLYQGNMLDMLDVIEENSIDAIVTDPPYELGFMGKSWDKSGIAFQKETWEKCLRVLKPGGHLLAFGAPRNYHRLACAIEDAGFEIRDSIFWVFGSGFPKSMNIGLMIDKKNGVESIDTGLSSPNARPNSTKENTLYESGTVGKNFTIKKANNTWDGWGTSLKPSYEPIVIARKPCEGTCIDNVLKYDVGGINIDECRVGMSEDDKQQYYDKQKSFENTYQNKESIYEGNSLQKSKTSFYDINTLTKNTLNLGRFPANTILTYDETDFDEVCGGFPNTKSNDPRELGNYGFWFEHERDSKQMAHGYFDSGSASRYFYCAKASKRDRDEGLDDFEEKQQYIDGAKFGCGNNNGDNFGDRIANVKRKNTHPTVKPTTLMQYLVRLVTPNGGVVLDPFNGSGSTGKAVMWENRDNNKNYNYIGIELTEEYLPIAKARIEYSQTCKEDQEKNIKSKSEVNEIKININKLF